MKLIRKMANSYQDSLDETKSPNKIKNHMHSIPMPSIKPDNGKDNAEVSLKFICKRKETTPNNPVRNLDDAFLLEQQQARH